MSLLFSDLKNEPPKLRFMGDLKFEFKTGHEAVRGVQLRASVLEVFQSKVRIQTSDMNTLNAIKTWMRDIVRQLQLNSVLTPSTYKSNLPLAFLGTEVILPGLFPKEIEDTEVLSSSPPVFHIEFSLDW